MTTHIDPHALNAIASLQRRGTTNLLARVIELFKSESPRALLTIQDALDAGELLQVRNAAHTLRSSSAYVGAKTLSDRCRDLEIAAREEDYAQCMALGDGLDVLFADCCHELDTFLVKAA